MLLNTSEERRYGVKRILVDHIKTSRKKNNGLFYRNNIKLHGDKPTESKKEIARSFIQQYLDDTSFHGVKYLGKLQIKTGILGKLFWALIMICSFAFLTWMLWKFWIRYSANPIRTVVESFQSPIYMIPFPAITMCPLIPPLITTRRQLLERLRLPRNMTNQTAMFLLKYGPAFSNEYSPGGRKYVGSLKTLLKLNHLSLVDFVKALRPCEDLIESCFWHGVKQNCSEIFKISYTFVGICCSFNYLLEDHIETGRHKNDSEFIRTTLFGARTGLTVVLHRNLLSEDDGTGDKFVRFSTNSVGIVVYKINADIALKFSNVMRIIQFLRTVEERENAFRFTKIIYRYLVFPHHPLEYVGIIASRQILQAGQELRIAITPATSQKLAGYYRENAAGEWVPHCADQNIKLKYFPTYHYSNCFTSCSIQAAYEICGCVPIYYKPIATKYSLRICEWEDFKCLYENTNNTRIIRNIIKENFTCECQTPCRSIFYEIRTSSLLLNGDRDYNVSPLYKNLTKAQAILKVFMASESFIEMTTIPIADELYLLASIGGIFSLFLGCSFLSAVEIIYFIGLYLRSYFHRS